MCVTACVCVDYKLERRYRFEDYPVTMSEKTEGFEPFTMITQEGGGTEQGGIFGKLQAGKEWIQGKHSGVRPWAEFLNVKRVSKPQSAADVTKRLVHNVTRFQSNYLFVFLGLVLYCV